MKADILITGSTGKTGLPLVQLLSDSGVSVRALVHTPEKRGLVEKKNVEKVLGDFGDPQSLVRALTGIEKAYLATPPSQDQVKHQMAFVDAAKQSGLKYIVKLSALGTGPDSPAGLLRWHAEVEEYIRKSGIAYTFLHPHFFMENLLSAAAMIERDGAIYSPLGDARFSPISAQDIALVAAKLLTGAGHAGRSYVLTGPDAVTYEEIAKILSEVKGKPVRYVAVSFEAAREGMIASGFPGWMAEDMIRMMKTWVEEGKGNIVSQQVEKIGGKKPLSLREFLIQHRSAFQRAA